MNEDIVKGLGMSNPGQERFAEFVSGLSADIYVFVIDSTRIDDSLDYLINVADNYSDLVKKSKYCFVLYTKTDIVNGKFEEERDKIISKLNEVYNLENRLIEKDVVLSGFGDIAADGLEEELYEVLTTYFSHDKAEDIYNKLICGKSIKDNIENIESIVPEEDIREEIMEVMEEIKEHVEEYYFLKEFLANKVKELREQGEIKDHFRVFFLGIGSAGKTTALKRLAGEYDKKETKITISHDLIDFELKL